MKPKLLIALNCFLFAGALIFLPNVPCSAEESDSDHFLVELKPVRYTWVKGNEDKYSLHHWMNDGYSGGFKDVDFKRTLDNKTTVEFEGSAILDQDIYGDLLIKNEDQGSIHTEYRSFRKYFDNQGGFYRPFASVTSLAVNSLSQNLDLDASHFTIELNKPLSEKTDVGLVYERHEKVGTKSRLAWTPVAFFGLSKNIGPSWQQVDDSADKFTLKGKTEVKGVTLKGEQSLEYVRDNSFREEKSLSNVSGSATKIRRQSQIPHADSYVTTLRGEKWMRDDESFVAVAYRYNKLKNSEVENLTEYDETGAPFNYTSPKNTVNAFAENWYDSHTWTGHYIANMTSDLNFITKFKGEVIKNRGNSWYPHDSNLGTPNGLIDTIDSSHVEGTIYRTGENFSLQYSGLPKTSLYTEVELEQTRNHLSEERDSLPGAAAADITGESLSRETLTHISKAVYTIGSRSVFSSHFNITNQYKHRMVNNTYKDVFETVSTGSAKSAFFDALRIPANEASTRFTWKPFKWIQSSFRYQLADSTYWAQIENQIKQKSKFLSNIFTYDVSLQPMDDLLVLLSYSQQNSKVSTPAASIAVSTQTSGSTSNVDVWLLSTSYGVNEKLVLTDSVQYSRAKNFADGDSYSLASSLAADYSQLDASIGLEWSPKTDLKINPGYSYSFYDANSSVAYAGNYNAHTVWLDVTFNW